MIVLVSGATATWPAYRGRIPIGQLTSPAAGNRIWADRWAMDNDAFGKTGFNPAEFAAMLEVLKGTPGCLFIACPDVVCDAKATLARFRQWEPRITPTGFPVAFVTQDSQRFDDVPWGRMGALFVGGSDAWKTAEATELMVGHANRLGLWTHMGRVNTRARFRLAWEIGCKSCDGTGWSKFAREYILRGERWARETQTQRLLWT